MRQTPVSRGEVEFIGRLKTTGRSAGLWIFGGLYCMGMGLGLVWFGGGWFVEWIR